MSYYLVYVSAARHLLDDAELTTILEQSRRNNERLQVTGAMLYQDGNIMQALEGDLDVVEDLYRRIEADPRHSGISRVYDGWSADRQFGDWSMAFGDLGRHATPIGAPVLAPQTPSEDAYGQAVARMLLASFRSTLNLRGAAV